MSHNTKKFYQPGTLEQKGTKISLKTQPYINGVVFDVNDPIVAFRTQIAMIHHLVHQYEYIANIPGMTSVFNECVDSPIPMEEVGKAKLLLEYLAQSPIEIILKEQPVDTTILNDLVATQMTVGRQ